MLSPAFIHLCMCKKGRFTKVGEKAVGISLGLVLAGHFLPYDKERLDHFRCLLCPIEMKTVEESNNE